jgi:hypothetical protein
MKSLRNVASYLVTTRLKCILDRKMEINIDG